MQALMMQLSTDARLTPETQARAARMHRMLAGKAAPTGKTN
jgi:hypothetical protein